MRARIVNVLLKDGEEFIRLDTGALIRLVRLESVDDVRFASSE